MAKKSKKSPLSSGQKAAIGVGLTAAAVTAAGAYFLYGSPNAAKNRGKVKSWMLKAKAEVLETLENAEEMTEREFHELVNGIASAYTAVQGATKGEIADFKREMKDNWKKIEKSAVVKRAKKTVSTTAKRVVKKAVKKKPKKAAKKKAKKAAKKTARKTTKK